MQWVFNPDIAMRSFVFLAYLFPMLAASMDFDYATIIICPGWQ
jgi:hypothetical protein